MANKIVKVALTKSQCKNLADFIEFYFIQSIRDDTDIDNINYLVDMCAAYKVLRESEGIIDEDK
jgi:hypothetical protein